MIRVFLLDDHEIVRSGIKSTLEAEEDMEVVGEAGAVATFGRLIAGVAF